MGACNGRHTQTFTHLELDCEGLDLSDLDLGEFEGPPRNDSSMIVYTVSLELAKGAENDRLASVLRSFLRDGKPQLYYRPGVPSPGRSFRERAQERLRKDLALVFKGIVPPNATRDTAAPV
jgi:hypothetical protein